MNGLHMLSPRLIVLARRLPGLEGDLEDSLSSLLDSKVTRVDVKGPGPYSYSADYLLSRTVLGTDCQGQPVEHILKGALGKCGLYVGIKTPKEDYAGQRTSDGQFDIFHDGMFDIYQLGERGFDLANKNHIPAVLLDTYDPRTICDFVRENTI